MAIIALYARGMTTRDIRAHLREIYKALIQACRRPARRLAGVRRLAPQHRHHAVPGLTRQRDHRDIH